MERALNMVMRIVLRKLVNTGINTAMRKAAGGTSGGKAPVTGAKHMRRAVRTAGRAGRL